MGEPSKHDGGTKLLHRVGKGDEQAVAECIDRFGGLVWSLARKHVGNPSEAEDAVQEVFIEIWKNAARYDESTASESTFVTMIARRRLIDRWRRRGRRVDVDAADIHEMSIATDEDGRQQVEQADEVVRVTDAMRRLRPKQQKVLNLAVCEGAGRTSRSVTISACRSAP